MAIYVAVISGMTSCEEGDLSRLDTAFVSQEGIIGVTGTDLAVQEQDTPDMTVKVKAGSCFVLRDAHGNNDNTLKFWYVVVTADTNVTITNNASGNPRIDRICVKVDTGVSPDATASNVATLVAVVGTPGASPSAPTVPNNHLCLAQVAVADGETAINTGDITDEREYVGLQLPINEGYRLKDTGGSRDARFYQDSSGNIYIKGNKSGGYVKVDQKNERLLIANRAGVNEIDANRFSIAFPLSSISVATDTSIHFAPGVPHILDEGYVEVDKPPGTDKTLTVDINKNGSTVLDSPMSIAGATAKSATGAIASGKDKGEKNDVYTVDIDVATAGIATTKGTAYLRGRLGK